MVTRQHDYGIDSKSVQIAASLDDALQLAEMGNEEEAFIVGGAELYREALPQADRFYFTEVAADVKGDTYFPLNFDTFEWDEWESLETEAHDADSENDFACIFLTLERCKPNADGK